MSDVVWKFVLQFFSQPLHMKLFSPIYILLRLVLRGFLGRKRRDEIISKLNYHKNNVSDMAPLFLLSRFFRSPCFLRKSSYERRVREQLIKKGGKVFVDIGANIGFYTLVLSRNFRIIYAIEPNPRIFHFLLDNVKTVGVTNVRCIQKAVSDKNGILRLFLSRGPGTHSLLSSWIRKPSTKKYVDIETVTLETLLCDHETIDLVKVDVEGAEWKVLNGAKNMMKKVESWLIELHDITRKNELENLLKSHGYNIKLVDSNHIYGEKR